MSPDEWYREFGSTNLSATGLYVSQWTAMQTAPVMACVSILSEDVAKLPVHVYRRDAGGAKIIQENHPLERLLRKPNGWQNRFEFIEQMQAALLLRGNAYAVILRDARGVPTELVPINPDQVTVYEAKDHIFYTVARSGVHQASVLSHMPVMIAAEDMFHLRWLSSNGLVGLSRIALAREAIALSLAQQEQAARLAGNGARPAGGLMTDKKLSEDVYKRLAADFQQAYGGLNNTGRTVILEEGMKWMPFGMTSADAEFLASRKFQVEEIARLYRIPPHKLGITDRAVAAGAAVADQEYMNNVVSSYVERWEAKLDETFDLSSQGLFTEFDVSRFLRADITARYGAYRTGIVGSFLTPNEARRAEGLPDMEGGDVLFQPTNVAPLGWSPTSATGSGPGSDVTGAPADGGRGDPAAPPDLVGDPNEDAASTG